MNQIRLLTISLLLALLTVGCAVSQQAKIDRTLAWQDRLEPIGQALRQRVEIEGTPLVIVRRAIVGEPSSAAPDDLRWVGVAKVGDGYTRATFDTLEDPKTGRALLPTTHRQLVHVPGRGLFMRTPGLFTADDEGAGYAVEPTPWQKLDPRTLEPIPTKVRSIVWRAPLDQPIPERFAAPIEAWTLVAQLELEPHPQFGERMAVEFVRIEDGEPRFSYYSDVLGDASSLDNGLWLGDHWLVSSFHFGTDQRVSHVIHRDGKLKMSTEQDIEQFELRDLTKPDEPTSLSLTMMRVEGTTEQEDLWLPMTRSGHFAAMPGIVGYRPVNAREDPTLAPGEGYHRLANGRREVHRWFAKRTEHASWQYDRDGKPSRFLGRWGIHRHDLRPEVKHTAIHGFTIIRTPYPHRSRRDRLWRSDHRQLDSASLGANRYMNLLCIQYGDRWEAHGANAGFREGGRRSQPAMTGSSPNTIVQVQTASAERTLQYWQREIERKRRELAEAPARHKREYWAAATAGDWKTAGPLALRVGGAELQDFAMKAPRPTLNVLDLAIQDAQGWQLKSKLRQRRNQLARTYEREREKARIAKYGHLRSPGYAGQPYTNPQADAFWNRTDSAGTIPYVYKPSWEERERIRQHSTYSPHAVRMGWQWAPDR